MTALFLMYPVPGHVNSTFLMANALHKAGYRVVYGHGGTLELAGQIQQQGFLIHWLTSNPFGLNLEESANINRQDSYMETLIDKFTNQNFRARTYDLQNALSAIKPDLIFLDVTFSTDFIILYPLRNRTEIIFIQTKFSTYYSPAVPPLNCLINPQDPNVIHAIKQA